MFLGVSFIVRFGGFPIKHGQASGSFEKVSCLFFIYELFFNLVFSSRLIASQSHQSNDSSGDQFFSPGEPQQLQSAISAGRNVRRAVDSFASAQHSTVQQLLRWASREQNAAIRDVVHQISELDFMWLESQTDFKSDLADFEKTLSRIVDLEEHSLQVVSKSRKESKAKQRILLSNVQNDNTPSNATGIQDAIVQQSLRENEVQKLLQLKKSLNNLSKAYMKLGEHCTVIFEAQQRIADLLPDGQASVSECPQLSDVRYDGGEASRAFVAAARAKLSKQSGTSRSKCSCQCGGRRHRSKSRVQRRCSEPVLQRQQDSDSEYEDVEIINDNVPTPPNPPPYNYASAPPAVTTEVNIMTAKFEEAMHVTKTSSNHQGIYPPIPVQTSTGPWLLPSPPSYTQSQRL